MARKIWRYTLSREEQRLWDLEGMDGWRQAMVGCVEDEAREEGCQKYMLFGGNEEIIAKGDVRKIQELQHVIV
jgi:hypothetical protein